MKVSVLHAPGSCFLNCTACKQIGNIPLFVSVSGFLPRCTKLSVKRSTDSATAWNWSPLRILPAAQSCRLLAPAWTTSIRRVIQDRGERGKFSVFMLRWLVGHCNRVNWVFCYPVSLLLTWKLLLIALWYCSILTGYSGTAKRLKLNSGHINLH